jgi:hypothetical protein
VWRPDLLGGVIAINGKWKDGTPMLAVPNYARMNRVERHNIQAAGDASVNYAPGATNAPATANPPGSNIPPASAGNQRPRRERKIESKVWMNSLA